MKAKVYHAEVWGLREDKYSWLLKNDIKSTKWKRLNPKSEFYLFIPRDERLIKQYKKFVNITNIFCLNNVGIVTSRDDFVTDIDKEALRQRIRIFKNQQIPDEIIRQTFNLQDTSKFKLKDARTEIYKEHHIDDFIKKILFRPFDNRWIFYHNSVIERTRAEVMNHMMQNNIALITVRQVAEKEFNHIFISDKIINYRVTLSAKGGCYLFPLYLFEDHDKPKGKKKNPFALATALLIAEPTARYDEKTPNFTEGFKNMIADLYQKPPTPEEIFYYIYAVLYSNTYRTRYAEFLKIDFPRVPFTRDYDLFKKMSKLGNRLADLHLLKSQELNTPIAQFKVQDSNKIQKIRYDAGRVYINNEQYFKEVPLEVWQYQIGGYQVCDKWLKDRKDRVLSLEDTQTYCRIVTAIAKTIEIQKGIDEIYEHIETSA
ncbi:MAG: hypothetical protein N3A62_06795 [Thermodesulfovibrionales bacterium]|nr:hypothetical protein [Thermodesulfovibrionales bacterium]